MKRHPIRGALGFGALVGSVALIPSVGLVSPVFAPIGLILLRGCPTCWAVELIATISQGRLQNACVDGRCEVRRAERTTVSRWTGP